MARYMEVNKDYDRPQTTMSKNALSLGFQSDNKRLQ